MAAAVLAVGRKVAATSSALKKSFGLLEASSSALLE